MHLVDDGGPKACMLSFIVRGTLEVKRVVLLFPLFQSIVKGKTVKNGYSLGLNEVFNENSPILPFLRKFLHLVVSP